MGADMSRIHIISHHTAPICGLPISGLLRWNSWRSKAAEARAREIALPVCGAGLRLPQPVNLLFMKWENLVRTIGAQMCNSFIASFQPNLVPFEEDCAVRRNNSVQNEVTDTSHLLQLQSLQGRWLIIFHSQQWCYTESSKRRKKWLTDHTFPLNSIRQLILSLSNYFIIHSQGGKETEMLGIFLKLSSFV